MAPTNFAIIECDLEGFKKLTAVIVETIKKASNRTA